MDTTYYINTLAQIEAVSKRLGRFFTRHQEVSLGLREILLNSLEHGNLGIGFEQKSELMRAGLWQQEIEFRQNILPYRQRNVQLSSSMSDRSFVIFRIMDEGNGFDWEPFLTFDPLRQQEPNGRGIALAKNFCFDNLVYHGLGNCVDCYVDKRHLRTQATAASAKQKSPHTAEW